MKQKIEGEQFKNLSNIELLWLAKEVNAKGDQEYLDQITDELKRRKEIK